MSLSSKSFPLPSYTTHQFNSTQLFSSSLYEYLKNIAQHTDINRFATNNNSFCQVCGDNSNGKHYGILACNGCSGFFKRSVRRKLVYRCHANTGRCIINKTNRNQCQACRLKKCLKMGMIKEAVQNERQQRSTTQVRMNLIDLRHDHSESKLSTVHHQMLYSTTNINTASNLSPHEACMLSSIRHNNEYNLTNKLNDSVYIVSSQILLIMIQWMRNLPTFLNLPSCDQLILLDESWSELFLLWTIQYSISLNNGGPIFHSIKLHHENEDEKLLHDAFCIFKQLQVDSIEFTCLKTIVLFRFDIRTLTEMKLIETIQDQAQITLAQYLRMHSPTELTRFGRLLLTLPLLRSISSLFIEKTYFSRVIGKISMSKLLADMLKN